MWIDWTRSVPSGLTESFSQSWGDRPSGALLLVVTRRIESSASGPSLTVFRAFDAPAGGLRPSLVVTRMIDRPSPALAVSRLISSSTPDGEPESEAGFTRRPQVVRTVAS